VPGQIRKSPRAALIYGQMTEPPGIAVHPRGAHRPSRSRNIFRDQEQPRRCSLFIDNIFRFVQAGSEVSALFSAACLRPSATSRTSIPKIGRTPRAHHFRRRADRLLRCRRFYVSRRRLQPTLLRPATFAHLDATTNLSRQIVRSAGIYPAVDPLAQPLHAFLTRALSARSTTPWWRAA